MPDLPRSFSPSSAGTYSQCPRRWRFRYVQKLPDPPGEPALLGTFAHRVLELLCSDPAPERTVERARELAGQVWPETADSRDFQALQLDEAAQRDFRWRAWTAIQGLWSLEDPADVEVRATEQKVSANLDGVPFFGIVDRLDVDADGLVSRDEYVRGNDRLPPIGTGPARQRGYRQRLKSQFGYADQNGDGKVSPQELQSVRGARF